MTEVYLLADKRENKNGLKEILIETFKQKNTFKSSGKIYFAYEHLTIGDYLIVSGGMPLAVIERKTLKDYAASMKDDRHENRLKMMKLREGNTCKVYYLVEGALNPKYTTMYEGIEYSKILSSIRSLEIIDNIHVIRTKNMNETAEALRFLTEKYTRLIKDKEIEIIGGDIDVTLKEAEYTTEEETERQIKSIWTSISGISKLSAPILMKNFTLRELIEKRITDEMLADIRVNNRKLTKKGVAGIKDYDSNKLLSSFPGISKITTFMLLNKYSLIDVINKEKKDEISKLQISDKRKLGSSILEKITNIADYKQEIVEDDIDQSKS